jgi:predicted nucleic acid-binding protein
MTVVDASVAVKWLLPERGSDEAQALLDSGESLAAPALIVVEVAAAIARKSRRREVIGPDAQSAFDLWLKSLAAGVIELVPDRLALERAFRLAATLEHPLQDCVYLAVAERITGRFVTADARFAAKANKAYQDVRLLGLGA